MITIKDELFRKCIGIHAYTHRGNDVEARWVYSRAPVVYEGLGPFDQLHYCNSCKERMVEDYTYEAQWFTPYDYN